MYENKEVWLIREGGDEEKGKEGCIKALRGISLRRQEGKRWGWTVLGFALEQKPWRVDGLLPPSPLLPPPPPKVVEEGKSWRILRCPKLPEKHRFLIKGQWMRCRDSRTPKILHGTLWVQRIWVGARG